MSMTSCPIHLYGLGLDALHFELGPANNTGQKYRVDPRFPKVCGHAISIITRYGFLVIVMVSKLFYKASMYMAMH